MSKILRTVLVVAMLSLLATQIQAKDKAQRDKEATETITYYFACARGFLEGMERGLYKRTNWAVNETCLGEQTVKDTVEIYNIFFADDEAKDFFKIMSLAFQIKHEQDAYCQFDVVMNDVLRWCDMYDCTLEFMLNNILKKVIQITTVATDISNILSDPSGKPAITDTEYYFNMYETIATGFGKFIRYITNFDITKLPQ